MKMAISVPDLCTYCLIAHLFTVLFTVKSLIQNYTFFLILGLKFLRHYAGNWRMKYLDIDSYF